MCPRVRALQSFDPQRSSVKAYVRYPQVNRFTTAQAVPVHHQEQQMIPDPLATSFGSLLLRGYEAPSLSRIRAANEAPSLSRIRAATLQIRASRHNQLSNKGRIKRII
jgi:hypothetical protein